MSKTHWKKLQNPDYLGSYALDPGKDLIVTIQYVRAETVTGPDNRKDECAVVHFVERDIKPMVLNVTNSKTIAKLTGSPLIEDWAGQKIQIFVDKVKAFGDIVEALRIRATAPKVQSATVPPCSECGEKIGAIDGKRDAMYMANYTSKRYGRPLCSSCATALAEKEQEKRAEPDPLSEPTAPLDPEPPKRSAPEEKPEPIAPEEEDPFDEFVNE